MSQNSTIFNFFFKTTDENLPIQQLYLMYTIFIKLESKLTFIQFCGYYSIFRSKFTCKNSRSLFLSKFFFIKTQTIVKYNDVSYTGAKHWGNVLISSENYNPSNFWKRFQKLKRPQTGDNYNEFFINDFKKKFEKYNKLGFLVIHNSFFLVRVRSENFLKVLVNFSKPLLVTPKYSSSSISKYIGISNLDGFEFQFLRKNKVYNKGRYSRCRQNYRTGVYMCMYLSVVSIFGLYYWFYKFSFNFTYLWWFFIAFVASFFVPKIIKYRLYEPITLVSKVFDFFRWGFMIIKSIFF